MQAAITARRRLEEEEDNYSEALKSAYIVIFPPQTSRLSSPGKIFWVPLCRSYFASIVDCIHVDEALGQWLKLHREEVHILGRTIQG